MSKPLPADFPKTPDEWKAIVAAAPDARAPQTAARLADGVMVHGGGHEAVRAALAARRPRGPGKKPPKVLLSLRLRADVLDAWKASGPGWQTRMADDLARHAPRGERAQAAG